MLFERNQRLAQKMIAKACAAELGRNTNLRNVAGLRSHNACERNAAETTLVEIKRHPGGGAEEGSAAGILHDVVKKTAGTGNRAVLVINFAVDVTGVRLRDQLCSAFLVMVGPSFGEDAAAGRDLRKRERRIEIEQHEVALMGVQKICAGNEACDSGEQHHELRFDAANLRSRDYSFEHRAEKPVFVFNSTPSGPDVKITDQTLMIFDNEVGIPHGFTRRHQGAAAEGAQV